MAMNIKDNVWIKFIGSLFALFIFITTWMWLGGILFLLSMKLNIEDASFLTLYQYWYYYANDPHIRSWLFLASIGSLTLVVALPVAILWPKRRALFGTAKWAKFSDMKKAGLFSNDGIIVGKLNGFLGIFPGRYLIFGGTEHVLMSAPTRSGKGVSVVIPNLLSWKDSLVTLDIKQENWNITSGFRSKHGQACYLLNLAPRDSKSHRWNPLFYISDDPHFRINDIQKIGNMLFPKMEQEPPIWQSSARSLWLGLILYLFETKDLPVTMGEALRQITMGDQRLIKIVEERQQSSLPLSNECYLALKDYLDTPDKTRGSVRKGFASALELFYNPMIDVVTADNDFDLRELRKKRMSIYVSITPDDLERLAPLINLFFQQVIDLNTRELPDPNAALKYQCLLLMDEFASIGKVSILSKSISYIAGYGLRMLPIIQSPAQLREIYGHDTAENFIENHALQIVFAPKSIKVARELSDTLGNNTIKNKSRTRQLIGKASRSESASDHGRALLLPQEVKQIGKQSEIVLLEDCPPILCKKITWWKDPVFKSRGNQRKKIILPSPVVPILDPNKIKKGAVEFIQKETKKDSKETDQTNLNNNKSIEKFNIENYSCDFQEVEIPKGNLNKDLKKILIDKIFHIGNY
ncbi:MAG: type IV secretory system conjugative DNA transfer family protein [Pseudomonadota bacterium]